MRRALWLVMLGLLMGLPASAQAPELTLTRIDCGTAATPTDVGQRFSHGERLRACAFEIEKELGVGIAWLEQIDKLERQCGFADATHSLQTRNVNAANFD